MLMDDRVAVFGTCPQCGAKCFERLSTHDHCANCNYYETTYASFINIAEAMEIEKQLNEIDRMDAEKRKKEKIHFLPVSMPAV